MSLERPSNDSSALSSSKYRSSKRPTSERRIQANRRNALRSTGPTTAQGKRTVSRNAIKHGLLAREVVLTAGEGTESLKEFHDLAEQLCEHFDPVGVVEESLVETIAVCWWRKARVIRAENGEIRKGLDTLTMDRVLRNSDKGNRDLGLQEMVGCFNAQSQADPTMSPTPKLTARFDQCDLRGSRVGLAYLRALLEKAKSNIASDGHISKVIAEKIFVAFFHWDFLFSVWCAYLDRPENKTEDRQSDEVGDETTGKEHAVLAAAIDDRLKMISTFEGDVMTRENLAIDAEARSFSLPTTDATDKLLRYEAHLDRQLYRAMDQLERLQRQRKGETVPPPLSINLGQGR